MQKNPFKFLDSFTKDDREIFFGRDKEIEELHSRVFESKVLLVYGTSGTGKSSLINCGLANRFSDSDWLPLSVRRGSDINRSLFEALVKNALTRAPFDKINSVGGTEYNLEKLLRSVYLDHFKPVFLIFDQFEELFIFGSREEKDELIKNVARVIDSDIQCRFIFSLREEYLAGVTEFERVIPTFLSNRIRIEKMTRQNAIATIEGPCRINNIEVESGFAETLLQKLNPDTPEVELTWLQIYLDKIIKLAENDDHSIDKITIGLLEKAGDVKDILGTFLEEQISKLSDPEAGLVVLKSFVSSRGTKHQITGQEVIEYTGTFGKEIGSEKVKELIQRFIKLRILRDKDEDGRYELRHDSLASKIYEKITIVEKELLEVKSFIENAWSNFAKRGLLLTDEDLKYIAPYEDKLFLNEKNLKFIDESKQELHRARRRRLNFAIAAVSVIIVILSLFSIWAMRSRKNAIILKQMALEQKDVALRSKEEADSAKQIAVISQLQAEESTKLAVEARNQSEASRKEALLARENALKQKTIAERMSVLANEQADKAEEEKQIAEQQRAIAQASEEKAKRLSLLSTAQNLALKSVSIPMTPEIMGLLAVQAFKFNRNNGGSIDDPVIWRALDKANNTIDGSRHSVFTGSENEIRSLSENEHGLLSADMDGNILYWNEAGEDSIIADSRASSYINLISLSPASDKLISGYEDNRLLLKNLIQNNDESELRGHTSPIITAAWSENGDFLATGDKDSLIIIWNTNSQPTSGFKTFKANSSIKFLTFCGNDKIISIHDNGSINLWELNKDTCNLLYISKQARPVCAAWHRPSGYLVVGCDDGSLIFSHLVNPHFFEMADYNSGIHQIAFNHDFSLMAMATWDKVIRLFNYEKYFFRDDNIEAGINIDDLNVSTRSLIFTKDNKLVAGMSDKSIRIWITSSGELASLICSLVKRDMTDQEWKIFIGSEIPYENTCGRNQ